MIGYASGKNVYLQKKITPSLQGEGAVCNRAKSQEERRYNAKIEKSKRSM